MNLGQKLMDVLHKIEVTKKEVNKIALGAEALVLIDKILATDPYDVDALIWRMKLNSGWVYDKISAVIEDAEFIANEEKFGTNKMIGYDWLTWVYDIKMGMPEKAIEVIENQIVEAYSIFKERYKKDEYEGELLNKIAFLKHNNNQQAEALDLWKRSFVKYPFNSHRNAVAGMLFLEKKDFAQAARMLWVHYDWSFETEDGFRLKYTKKLKELYDKNELQHPDLIGIMYHGIRNETDAFGIKGRMGFYDDYLPKLKTWGEKFPTSSIIWGAIGNTYLLDVNNNYKAIEAYSMMLKGDRPTAFDYLDRIHESAKESETDFFSLPFGFEGVSGSLYNHLTEMSGFADEADEDSEKKKYLDLSLKYGERCFQQYYDYLADGKGSTQNNQPHLFAMSCNNYGLALDKWNEVSNEEKDIKVAAKAAKIHQIGFKMSPFRENLENGSSAFFEAKMYKECIEGHNKYLKIYSDDLSFLKTQQAYWYIMHSYSNLNKYAMMKDTYNRAKKKFFKAGPGVSDAAMKFAYTAKEYYITFIQEEKDLEEIKTEIAWFLQQNIFVKVAPKEVGLMNYFLGICHQKTNQEQESIAPFQKSVEMLQEEDMGYYYNKSEQAARALNRMGQKSGHNYQSDKPKSKTGFWSLFKKNNFF